VRCSFCQKKQESVRKLIAGPKVFICDECVEVCVDIINDDSRVAENAAPPMRSKPESGSVVLVVSR